MNKMHKRSGSLTPFVRELVYHLTKRRTRLLNFKKTILKAFNL